MAENRRGGNFQRGGRFHSVNRGRGGRVYSDEPRPNIGKALHNFGVRDLREFLNKKHETDNTKPGPPPDPPNSFLKDPTRDFGHKSESREQHKEENIEKKVQFEDPRQSPKHPQIHRNHGGRFSGRGRGRGTFHHNADQESSAAIKDPVNIKVELITATMERNCTLEEENKIAEIKHVPDHVETERRSFRGRGRGRRRGHGHKPGRNRESPGENSPSKSENDNNNDDNTSNTDSQNDNNLNADDNTERSDGEEQEISTEVDDNPEQLQNTERKVEINDSDEIKVNINNEKSEEKIKENDE